MNMALWAVQVLLALVFGLSGGMKTFMTIEALSERGCSLGSRRGKT